MRSLRHTLASAAGLKVAAVVGATILWMSLAVRPLSDASFEAHVQYVNVPENLELNPDQAEHVTVILRGTQPLLQDLRERGVGIQVDFSEVYGPGEKTLNVEEMNLGLPAGVHLVKAVPSQLRFTLETQARREVAVHPQFVGSYEKEYALAFVGVDPQQLVVVGPESRVALLDVVSTDPIDLSEVVGGRSFRVTAYLPDPYVRFERDPTVSVEVQMRKRE
jgi:YbbR domain-containing protein